MEAQSRPSSHSAVIGVAALFQRSGAVVGCMVSMSEIDYDTNSILSLKYVGNKNSSSITVGTNNILSFFPLRDLPIPSMASVLGNLNYYTYKYYQSDSRHTKHTRRMGNCTLALTAVVVLGAMGWLVGNCEYHSWNGLLSFCLSFFSLGT